MKANFTLSDGDKAVTDADGKAKVTLKGTKAGAHTVTASMVGGKSEQLVVNFTADTLTAQVNLNVTEDTRLQAIVTDGNGNPVEGIKVNFRGTSVTLSSTSVETDDQVFAEILVTSTEVGLKTVSASLADKPTEVISRLLNAKVDVNSATITSQEIPEGQVMVAQDIAVWQPGDASSRDIQCSAILANDHQPEHGLY